MGRAQPANQLAAESELHRIARFLRRVRYWILYASMQERKARARGLVKQVVWQVGLGSPTTRLLSGMRKIKRNLSWRTHLLAAGKTLKNADSLPAAYDVICLPVIAWNSRFQRPQQLMSQFAEHGHRVFYASLGFHGGADAELSPILPNVFEMSLPGTSGASVYRQLPSPEDVDRMASAIDRLRRERRIASAVVVIQLPFWTALAETLREKFGWPIVYDCMDDHSGFSTNCEEMLSAEDRTIAEADLVVVTSDVLEEKVRAKARRTVLVRNACDYEHFRGRQLASPPSTKTTVGFYGAIAEWFDADLVADLAELRPDWRFELIGNTFTGDVSRLEKLPNVVLLGEKPYVELPRLVAGWNCFIIPFKRIPLTEATNPVKAYEMLATGKPVVAVNLPELWPMAQEGLLALADDGRGFAEAIDRALTGDSGQKQERRCDFAAVNTWESRWKDLDAATRSLFPLASILIVTYNNLPLNKACLHSVFYQTDYPNYEVIVVDNASSDGTPDWLAEEARHEPRLQVILNRENRGFAAANNQALRKARGEFLCLLNNDTLATRGWLSVLIGHLRKNPSLGMVGPVSNKVGNIAVVPVGYKRIAKMPLWAEQYCREHDGETIPMDMLGFFCVLMSRTVYQRVGELDERFGIGYFEDDDYCRRVRAEGFDLRFARDAFIHHWHNASFRLMKMDSHFAIVEQNRKVFQAKWDPIDLPSLGKSSASGDSAGARDDDLSQILTFTCNVCGQENQFPRHRVSREDGPCIHCKCYGRLRAMMYAVTNHFSPNEAILARMEPRKDLRGFGCSDWGYDELLAKKFDYVNTFYDHEPQLNLCDVDWSKWKPESFDFITCTEVLEHVAPPVERTLANIMKLLKPGGVVVLTVPTTLEPATQEHFPDLHDWRIETKGKKHILINRRLDGKIERFRKLEFHGGEGLTVEFRLFSRVGLIESLDRAGFRIVKIHERNLDAYGIPLCAYSFVLVAQKEKKP